MKYPSTTQCVVIRLPEASTQRGLVLVDPESVVSRSLLLQRYCYIQADGKSSGTLIFYVVMRLLLRPDSR